LARKLDLKGQIVNRGNAGVRLTLQGEEENLEAFLGEIEKTKPKIAFIENIKVIKAESDKRYSGLTIGKSEEGRGISLTLPPDIAICENCIRDMRNSELQKYYNYPFIACAVCGPRFTTVRELPYDRERSTMVEFPFCKKAKPESCMAEYSNFQNRRFHAQTFACSVCGPNYQLYDKEKNSIKTDSIDEILKITTKWIKEGEVAAIKGIGGVHLVCLANDDEPILKLRRRKGKRKYKPFALMVPNLEIIEDYFNISERERELLSSFRRPIVVLEKNKNFNKSDISEFVAPGLNNIGIMLPYSGIHYLLFDHIGKQPLVYTSGNKSNIPMAIENEKIFDQLNNLADFFLLHNRPIFQRADDSVLRVHNNKVKLIRRSRGYAPEYLPLPFEVEIPSAIATGPELAVTGALLRRNRIFQTQHIGNVTHLETYDFLKNALHHMKKLLQIKDSEIKFIACDTHPAFVTTRLAKELSELLNVNLYRIQHHYAHALSLMAENKVALDEKIVCICTDGVGYGEDGNIWGGEVLLCSYRGYTRLGHLENQPMIGGDRCTKYPARMTASIVLNSLGVEKSVKIFKQIFLENGLEYKNTELKTIVSEFERADYQFPNENISLTSSTGRIFDVISYILGASNLKSYRGEPAMRLEGLASKGNPDKINLDIAYSKKIGSYIINTSDLILDVINLLEIKESKRQDIAAKFQKEIGIVFANVAIKIAKENDTETIGLTGGVAYNGAFSKAIKETIIKGGFSFIEHNLVPPGDAGISVGQLIGGTFKYNKNN
jgi:hydrogenase maturation protein HypF